MKSRAIGQTATRSYPSSRFLEILPFLVVVIVSSILFLPLILSGKVLFWGTSSTQFISWLSTAWDDVAHGILPLWNPYNGMGAPLLANYQLALFYPPIWMTLIFYLIKGNSGLATGAFFLIYLHVIWTGLGMVFLTRKLGMKPFPRILSSLGFSLSGCFLARANFFSMIWAIAWIPWIMLICLNISQPVKNPGISENKRFRVKNSLFLILVIAMQLFSGHAQITWYTFLFAIAWMGFWGWQQGKLRGAFQNIFILGLCAFAASLLAAVQLLPTLEYLLQTPRASSVEPAVALNYSFWPGHLLNFFSSEFFGNPAKGDYWGFGAFWEDAVYFGFLPFILVIFTIKSFLRNTSSNRNIILFLWCAFGITLMLALGKNLPIFPFLFRFVPTFNFFQAPARFMVIGVFCLSLLAGFGVEYWKAPIGRWLYVCRLGVMAGIAILVGALIGLTTIKGDLVTLIRGLIFVSIGMIIFCVLTLRIADSFRTKATYFTWIILASLWISGDLLINSFPLIPTTDKSFYDDLAAQTSALQYQRLWISESNEYDLKFGRFFRFDDFRALEDWVNIRKANLPNTNLLSDIRLVNNFDPFVPDRFQMLMNILEKTQGQNRTELLQLMNVFEVEQIDIYSMTGVEYKKIEDSSDYEWYECVKYAKSIDDAQLLLTGLLNDPSGSLKKTLIIEGNVASTQEQCESASPIQYEETFKSSSQKEIVVDAAKPGWLLISSTYYPGWVALIDGKETTIYSAMLTFQSVEVPAGRHVIQFFYRPQTCYYGAIISIMTLIGICIAFGFIKKAKKEDIHGNKNDQ